MRCCECNGRTVSFMAVEKILYANPLFPGPRITFSLFSRNVNNQQNRFSVKAIILPIFEISFVQKGLKDNRFRLIGLSYFSISEFSIDN